MAEDVPNEAAASSNLGVLLATSDTQKARQLLERAVQLRQEQRGRATTEGEVQEAQRALAGTLTNLAGLVKVTENARAAMSFYKLVRTCVCVRPLPSAGVPSTQCQPPCVCALNVRPDDTGLKIPVL
jgi:hypothetical protein